MKYCSEITGWGKDALFFLNDAGSSFLILFNDNAPEELAEISVLHTPSPLLMDLEQGDTLLICDKPYTITAIGDEAKSTFRELGHCTLTFRGDAVPERPGCIMLDGERPLPEEIVKGGKIEIF